MVRALLNTKPNTWPAEPLDPSKPFKWMTRRPVSRIGGFGPVTEFGESDTSGYKWHFRDKRLRWNDVNDIIPPYQKGDILWVREIWAKRKDGEYRYKSDSERQTDVDFWTLLKWKSPAHMPREAARITLEVKGVKVEKLDNIDNKNVIAEGFENRSMFFDYWNKLNQKRKYGTDFNPYVYVYSFMRIK
jgi:hypothetical protein